jgi:hypothetical protein
MRLDEASQVLWFGTMQAHQHCATLYYFVSDIETFNVALDRVGTCTEPDKARVF